MKVTSDDYACPMRIDGKLYHHVTGFLESMKHRKNEWFADEIRRERSASIAREMGNDGRLLWADIELGKRKLTESETSWFEQHKDDLRTKALLAKFSNTSLRQTLYSESKTDPEAAEIVRVIDSFVNRTTSRNQSRDPSRTGRPDQQSLGFRPERPRVRDG